jgi:nucleolar MIF4G domain-containing protein 1
MPHSIRQQTMGSIIKEDKRKRRTRLTPTNVVQTLNFAYLQTKTKSFLEVLILTALKTVQQRSEKSKGDSTAAIVGLFSKAKDVPQVLAGLQYFLAKEVSVSDFATNAAERKRLKLALKTASDTLALLSSSTRLAE